MPFPYYFSKNYETCAYRVSHDLFYKDHSLKLHQVFLYRSHNKLIIIKRIRPLFTVIYKLILLGFQVSVSKIFYKVIYE